MSKFSFVFRSTLLAVCVAHFATAATAQPISFPRKTVSTEAAEKMVNACLDWYRAHPNPGKPAIWVLNANGETIYMKRLDGATRIGVVTGKMKADTALYFFSSSKASQAFLKTPTGETSPTGIVMNLLLDAYPSPGGVAIIVDGAVLGAIGVGGMVPDMAHDTYPDEQCAQAGIDAVFKK